MVDGYEGPRNVCAAIKNLDSVTIAVEHGWVQQAAQLATVPSGIIVLGWLFKNRSIFRVLPCVVFSVSTDFRESRAISGALAAAYKRPLEQYLRPARKSASATVKTLWAISPQILSKDGSLYELIRGMIAAKVQ